MFQNAPGSPSRRTEGNGLNEYISALSIGWDLRIEPPRVIDSPKRSKTRAIHAKEECAEACVSKIKHLWFKDQPRLLLARKAFEADAKKIRTGWVHKPNAEQDVLPISSNRPQTPLLREKLLQCLLDHVSEQSNIVKEEAKSARKLQSQSLGEKASTTARPAPTGARNVPSERMEASPAVSNDNTTVERKTKRNSDGLGAALDSFKKPKIPAQSKLTPQVTKPVQDLPVKTYRASDPTASHEKPMDSYYSNFSKHLSGPTKLVNSANTSFNSDAFDPSKSSSANTSFASTVFSQQPVLPTQTSFYTSFEGPGAEEDPKLYGSDIDEEDLNVLDIPFDAELDAPSQCEANDEITQRLKDIFPVLPKCLESQPFYVRYEITRYFQHANAPMENLVIPRDVNLSDYVSLWRFLQNCSLLKNKPPPEKSSKEAWDACLGKYTSGFTTVVLSAYLMFQEQDSLFKFRLLPLKMKMSHRLARRFGPDRFLEVSMPSLSGRNIPKVLSKSGELGRQVVVKWIVNEIHNILGVEWRSFFVKDARQKRPGESNLLADDLAIILNKRLYLFASGGIGFQSSRSLPPKDEDPKRHTCMTVAAMLNWLIPLQKNQKQPFLKLFSRIELGLSTTYETYTFTSSQIRRKKDLLSDDGQEVMNDGCGQISMEAAKRIAQILNLDTVPSAFQGRIGCAKGMWVVDRSLPGIWIDVYPSQMKWVPRGWIVDDMETGYRTFEVLKWVIPLKSARLNLQFLPILENRGICRKTMRARISGLLEKDLAYEMSRLRIAMDDPLACRAWLRESRSGIQNRLVHGTVPFKASLPASTEEILNMLLDCGFDPKKLTYAKKLAKQAYLKKGDTLKKRMNITVGQSAYAFMVVDFSGVLKPNEIHLGFSSNFQDEQSGFNETMLHDRDVLIARSPAHLVSDIQKVKAVFKLELMHLKDVIVISSKGNFPLAGKLSGGDYDGDIAWLCWDEELVSNFRNADMPECPDLVMDGYLTQECTIYADLMKESPDPTNIFLTRSIDFNLRDNLLGIATNYKEEVTYTLNNVQRPEAVFLSTLLSCLVDQAKQGYSLTPHAWQEIRSTKINVQLKKPAYKSEKLDGRLSGHIIDHLKFVVAKQTIDKTLSDYDKSLTEATDYDEDLVKFSRWAKDRAKLPGHEEWAEMMVNLEADIKRVKESWSCFPWQNNKKEDEKEKEKEKKVLSVYQEWLKIKPRNTAPSPAMVQLHETLDPSFFGPEHSTSDSTWARLRASVAFSHFHSGKFVWSMAAKPLCSLKVIAQSSGTSADGGMAASVGNGGIRAMTEQMYAALKPDTSFIKRRLGLDNIAQGGWGSEIDMSVDEYGALDFQEG